MLSVPLGTVPNQAISFNADGAYWQIHVYQSKLHMCADISANGVSVASGVRCFVGIPLQQYPYMYLPNYGNFIFDSDPDWTNFGVSCNLYYLSLSEFLAYQSMTESGVSG